MNKQNFIKIGYVHNFSDGAMIKSLETTKEDYESSSVPSLEGYTYVNSIGGAIIVNSPNVVLQENEYTIVGEKYFVCTKNEYGLKVAEYSEEEFNNIWQ